jgi:hypothetical protein
MVAALGLVHRAHFPVIREPLPDEPKSHRHKRRTCPLAPPRKEYGGGSGDRWVTTRMDANEIDRRPRGACGRRAVSVASGASRRTSNRSNTLPVCRTQEMIVGSTYRRCSRCRLRHVSRTRNSRDKSRLKPCGESLFRVRFPLLTLAFQGSRATDGGDTPGSGTVGVGC